VIKAEGKDFPAVTFGKLDNVQVGDAVLAIGSPFGFGSSVTHGIVSALGRNHLGINRFEDFIQTDAAVNPGNSGGALVDAGGNLIGINSAIFSASGGSQGIGFAIPITIARSVLEQIIRDGEVTRGWLGIEPQELTPELATSLALPNTDGVLIRSVLRSGPAERAGMLARDVVVELDGKPTHDVTALLAQIAALTPGTQTRLKILRAKKSVELDVVVGKRPRIRTS
jgi:serine protease DegQ